MFALKIGIVLIGCAIVTQASPTWKNHCNCYPCGLGSGESMCGCKYGIYGASNWGGSGSAGASEHCRDRCEPIVVRPQEVLRPATPPVLTPVPGPCACKKAIVKPAILPKPVCKPTPCVQTCTCSCSSNNCNHNHNCQSTSTLIGIGGAPLVLGTGSVYNPAVLAPADAVSIAIAQQNAQQRCILDEDRLAFGFRKIPIEIPIKKIIRQNNIPEEKIFSLNGQIVELKPGKGCCSTKSLDEEAAEDLLALQDEETAKSVDSGSCCSIKRISLGELGYVPAQISENTFADVPAAAAETITTTAETIAEDLSGFKAGKVVYKTVPNPTSIVIPAPVDTTDCQSREIGEQSVIYEEAVPCNCGHSIYHSSSSSSSSSSSNFKKASIIVQKLCNRD